MIRVLSEYGMLTIDIHNKSIVSNIDYNRIIKESGGNIDMQKDILIGILDEIVVAIENVYYPDEASDFWFIRTDFGAEAVSDSLGICIAIDMDSIEIFPIQFNSMQSNC